MQATLDYLDHRVSSEGLVPLPHHLKAVQVFLLPFSVTQLQRFLGLINFYRRFLPVIAGVLQPLTDALAGNTK